MTFDVSKGGVFLRKSMAQPGQPYRYWKATVLDQKTRDRMVVQYTLSDSDTDASHPTTRSRTVIGKFFSDQSAQVTFYTMRAIHTCLNKPDDAPCLAIPHAITYEPRLRLLVQEKVPGVAYTQLVTDDKPRRYFVAAGRALARLHRLSIDHGHPKRMDDHIRELIRPHPSELGNAYPRHRRLIQEVLQQLIAAETDWGDRIPIIPLHRDFHLRQLFYARSHVWLIDWDLYARGDPAFDVAYFIVYLKNHLAADQSTSMIEAFKEGYFDQQPDSILRRVPVYQAFNYLRRACRRYRLRDDQWEYRMTAMLRKMQRCIS